MNARYSFLILMIALQPSAHAVSIALSEQQARIIGNKIWHNECALSIEKLTFWKDGEEFPSLGIGHFIWYPASFNGPFTQTFPQLISFLQKRGMKLPSWLASATHCPWNSRAEFYADFTTARMVELRTLLTNTIELQTHFIIDRLVAALPKMLNSLPDEKQQHITKQFERVAQNPLGLYALIDYINFKGEGTSARERYNNQGWGLLQVLERMQGTAATKEALQEFATAAKQLLSERVAHSPQERNEKQWLKGWHNRIDTYTT